MAVEVTDIRNAEDMEFTAAADVTCGQVIVANGKVGVVKSLEGVKSGQKGILRVAGVAYLPAASATTFAAQADVQFNTTTRLAVASGGTHAGRAFYPKVEGQTVVAVELNREANPA